MQRLKWNIALLLSLFCFSLNAQWSRSDETVRLTTGTDKIWINDIAPIGGGTNRLFLSGDPSDYGNLLVSFQGVGLSASESLFRLGVNSSSNIGSKLLYGVHGADEVFDFNATGRLNLLTTNSNFNRALDIRNSEAIWYDGDYFSWGFGGNWNRFADPITIGGSTPTPAGTALLITGSQDVRLEGQGARRIRFQDGILEEGYIGYSETILTIQNDNGEYVQIRSNGKDQLFIGEDASLFGDLNMTGGINGISDERTKKNIKPIDSALENILSLNGRSYEFRTEEFRTLDLPKGEHFGLIAQEVEKIFPNLVSEHSTVSLNDQEATLKGIDYQEIIPVLIEAMKEQNKIIEDLKERIELLESNTRVATANLPK